MTLAFLILALTAQADPGESAEGAGGADRLEVEIVDPGGIAIESPGDPEEIVNGELENKWPQVVALGAGNFSACTGSLIAPRVILTAGHCSADLPLELVIQFGQAIFGPDVAQATDRIGLVTGEIHPDYVPLMGGQGGQTLPEYDLALLELAEDAPVEPIWFNTDKLKDNAVGEEVLSVGFGITSAAGAGGGVKRSATLVVDEIDAQFVLSNVATNPDGANICSGDSGGPQYHYDEATDTWEQWAVHSWGDSNCVYNSGSTRTDVAAEFILDFVERVHGTSDFCELTGRYDDGLCDPSCGAPDPDCNLPSGRGSLLASGGGGESAGGCQTAPGPRWAWLVLLPLLGYRRRR